LKSILSGTDWRIVTSVKIVEVEAEIRTGHLPNTSQRGVIT
jgi:hypothetical protein